MARIPKYRRRAGRDYAFVEIGGKRPRLPGKYGSKESREAYAEVLRSLARDQPLPSATGLVVNELMAAYLDHAESYYDRKEYLAFVALSGPVEDTIGDIFVSRIGALAFDRARNAMIGKGWCRTYVNKQVNRLRRVFKWGVAKELVPPSIMEAVRCLEPLRKGRCSATEAADVRPASDADVEATLCHCPPVLFSMIELQRLTGMRSQNLVAIRPMDVDRSRGIWVYRPPVHKGTWRENQLAVFLGPQSQAILKPFLDRPDDAPCFSPRESEAARNLIRRRPGAGPNWNGRLRNRAYTTDTYRQAVQYAIGRANAARKAAALAAGLDPPEPVAWHPHQLRHARATEIRPRYGLDGAQVFLGHAHADVTQIYAERDLGLARRIAADMG